MTDVTTKLCSDDYHNRLLLGIIVIDYDYKEGNHNRLIIDYGNRLLIDYFLFLVYFFNFSLLVLYILYLEKIL